MSKKVYTEEELIKIAEKRIKAKRDLFSHLASYIVVNAFLCFVNVMTDTTYLWFLWVLAAWGIGMILHTVETIQELRFNFNTNAINKELEKIKRHIHIDKE